MSQNPYTIGLDQNPANYVPLSPLTFLRRAAQVYPDHPSIVHGDLRYTWGQTYARCRRLASALRPTSAFELLILARHAHPSLSKLAAQLVEPSSDF